MISVCMATFNGARFVRQQLTTILEQLEPDDELVVSDDSSTDGTVAIVRSFADPRIRMLEGNTFHSPLLNFEHAIRHARGDTIALADQDDVWLENKLPLVRSLFAAEKARPFLVVLDAVIVDEDERVIHPSVQRKLSAGPGLLRNLWTNRYLGCCIAFSRDLLDVALPFPPGVDMHDIWLGQLCERVGTTAFVPVTTMRYRRHAATATGFEIRLAPVQQIRRRLVLAWSLARRGGLRHRAGSRAHDVSTRDRTDGRRNGGSARFHRGFWQDGPVPTPLTDAIRSAPPALHGAREFWGLAWSALGWLEENVEPGMATLETGAGASTVVFAAAGSDHEVITPESNEELRIRAMCDSFEVDSSRVTFRIGPSHEVLRTWQPRPLDIVLIDGAHGFPYPVIDWWFLSPHVRVGGLVLLDDAYLPAVAPIVDFVRDSPAWEIETAASFRTALVRKVRDEPPPFEPGAEAAHGRMRFGYMPPRKRVVASARQRVFSTRAGLWLVRKVRGPR